LQSPARDGRQEWLAERFQQPVALAAANPLAERRRFAKGFAAKLGDWRGSRGPTWALDSLNRGAEPAAFEGYAERPAGMEP
jgi:hypothetical protein